MIGDPATAQGANKMFPGTVGGQARPVQPHTPSHPRPAPWSPTLIAPPERVWQIVGGNPSAVTDIRLKRELGPVAFPKPWKLRVWLSFNYVRAGTSTIGGTAGIDLHAVGATVRGIPIVLEASTVDGYVYPTTAHTPEHFVTTTMSGGVTESDHVGGDPVEYLLPPGVYSTVMAQMWFRTGASIVVLDFSGGAQRTLEIEGQDA